MTWGAGLDIVEDEDPETTTAFEAQVYEHLIDRLDMIGRLTRADILARLGQYSVLWIGVGVRNDDLAQEFPRLSGPEALTFLTPVAQDRAPIVKYVEDSWDPRFGLPLYYEIKISDSVTRKVHWSRVVHVAEGLLESDVLGKPALRAVWNYLDDLQKIVGGGAEAAWKRMDPGMQLDLDPEMVLTPAEEGKLSDQVDEYVHGLRRTMQTRGVKVTPLSAAVAGFGPNAQTVIDLVAATSGYTQRWLMGNEQGEQATSQDTDNQNDRVSHRRDKFASPVTRELLDRLIKYGALVTPKKPYKPVWPAEEELTELEKATLALQMKQAGVHTDNEIRDIVWGLEPLEEEEPVDDDDPDPDDPDGELATLRSAADLADTDSSEPEWRAVHRAADDHVPALTSYVRGVWRDAADAIDSAEFTRELESGDLAAAESRALAALNRAHDAMGAAMPDRLRAVMGDSAAAVLRSVRARGSWYTRKSSGESRSALMSGGLPDSHGAASGPPGSAAARLSDLHRARLRPGHLEAPAPAQAHQQTGTSISSGAVVVKHSASLFSATFDTANPRAVSWAALRSSGLITEIGPDTLAAIRSLISAGIAEGVAPRKLTQYVRESVGLRSDQVEAVGNLRARLRAAKPGDLVKAGKVGIRVPKTGGNSTVWIDKHASAYAGRLLNQRALLISRTETLRSANAGQRELWKQAQEAGDLPADLKRVWIATPDARTREEHAAMDGQVVGVDEPFSPVAEPGSEPACRCAQGLVEA